MKLFDCTYLNSAGGKKILEIILENMSNEIIRDYFLDYFFGILLSFFSPTKFLSKSIIFDLASIETNFIFFEKFLIFFNILIN